MSTLPATQPSRTTPLSMLRPDPRTMAGLATFVSVLGVLAIWPTALFLWSLWVTDPLKSIGMFVPVVSLLLILRAWRDLGWELRGSWWGLVILVATVAAVRFREQSVLVLVLSPRWSIFFPPHSLVAFAYAAGAVLLFGGRPLLRTARFPLWLMWLVNPVPHIFNVFVDLPLQRVSAHVARAFAHALHQPLTPDQMRLMFTPDFGMFIAPGCNGIRGAVTMGMIALIVGYLYRFRPVIHAAFVAGAVLLGYVFNFVRLCTLVLFYIVALRIHWLQNHAEMGDYLIGAALFLAGVGLLFVVVRRAGHSAPAPPADESIATVAPLSRGLRNDVFVRVAAMLVLVGFGASRFAVALAIGQARAAAAASSPEPAMPQHLGDYERTRSWPEAMTGGPIIFEWADYAPPAIDRTTAPTAASSGNLTRAAAEAIAATHIAVGVSPTLGSHDTSICHSARGEDPIWHGQLTTATADGAPASFSASFYNSGARQWLEVATVCNGEHCGEYTAGSQSFGLIYSRPATRSALAPAPDRPIPLMFTAETTDTALPADLARAHLLGSMQNFLRGVRLAELTRPFRSR